MSAPPSARTDNGSVSLRDGRVVQIRPSRPEDVEKLLELHAALSPATRQARYFTAGGTKRQVDAERLAKADGSRDVVLVATVEGGEQIVAVGELARVREQAELALVVRDDYQEVGLGGHLFPGSCLPPRSRGCREWSSRCSVAISASCNSCVGTILGCGSQNTVWCTSRSMSARRRQPCFPGM